MIESISIKDMQIRYLNDNDDRYAVSDIYEKSWRYAYRGIIPQDYLDSIPKGHWVRTQDIPEWYTIVCVEDEKIIGTSSFSRSRSGEYPDYGEIISIYLLPEYMRKGYGTLLIKAALNELRDKGFKDVFLCVLEENTGARKFYEKMGFLCTDDHLDNNIGGRDVREVRYTYHFD